MITCGLPCMVIDNVYIKDDLPSDIFIKVPMFSNQIINKIKYYFDNKNELISLSKKCVEYAENNFKENENILFEKFIVDILN